MRAIWRRGETRAKAGAGVGRGLLVWLLMGWMGSEAGAAWDNFSDTWRVTDGLGRSAPGFEQVGPPRADRTVGIFYFLWLGPHAQSGGPWDISRILAENPEAMQQPENPAWGPLHAPHHWGESIFGYYNSDDPYVLRKHAQMLSDAGVDVVIFDVTNQLTYRSNYLALLREWGNVRALGNRTPQVAFLCPFWDPAKVVRELYRELYEPGIGSNLWFRWEGKPLILADREKVGSMERNARRDDPARLPPGETLGQTFEATNEFVAVGGSFPTWQSSTSGMTLRLRRMGPAGEVVGEERFRDLEDNGWRWLRVPAQPVGTYYLEMSEPAGPVGWWSSRVDAYPRGEAWVNGRPASGDRNLQVLYEGSEEQGIREFFTFRRSQPDYFRGQTAPDMWSWLEVFPQHVFTNSAGVKEEMSVGVAQNAVGSRLGSMSEAGARGRSFREGGEDRRPGAVNRGFNLAEQFERAIREDPRFIFITGWNEWIAGRFAEFNGIREPIMFVDEFNQERSRDIEPMKGGHGDDYYYQMADFIRRYKGVRPPPAVSEPISIRLEEGFAEWEGVTPEFRDDIGDTMHRDFPGYANHQRYVNGAGRNDIVAAKVARDAENVFFYVRTRDALTPATEAKWMWLLIDFDDDPKTGWEGFDWIVNRKPSAGNEASIERNGGGWTWISEGRARRRISGNEMQLAIPRKILNREGSAALHFNFKWADNAPETERSPQWLEAGDAAPNGRFTYHFEESAR